MDKDVIKARRPRHPRQEVDPATVADLPEVMGVYRVAIDGTIYRRTRSGAWVIAPQYGRGNDQRYKVVVHSDNGGQRRTYVHRLVAMAYLPNRGNLPEVNHIDGDPSNNHVNNLEWCTHSDNLYHAYAHGRYKTHTCTICGSGTHRIDDVCRPCRRAQEADKRHAVRLEVRSATAEAIIARYETHEMPPQTADIIRAWGAGMTDEQIAQACGVATKTASRIRRAYL